MNVWQWEACVAQCDPHAPPEVQPPSDYQTSQHFYLIFHFPNSKIIQNKILFLMFYVLGGKHRLDSISFICGGSLMIPGIPGLVENHLISFNLHIVLSLCEQVFGQGQNSQRLMLSGIWLESDVRCWEGRVWSQLGRSHGSRLKNGESFLQASNFRILWGSQAIWLSKWIRKCIISTEKHSLFPLHRGEDHQGIPRLVFWSVTSAISRWSWQLPWREHWLRNSPQFPGKASLCLC